MSSPISGTFDFDSPTRSMRIRSVHPGVSVDEVIAATGFDLFLPSDIPQSRRPSDAELRLIRQVIDPEGHRNSELSA